MNDLERFFEARRTGPGIWKWQHYFEIYDRHFAKFRGTAVRLVEIGIYSGGSLDMWRDYFGGMAHIIGVDIQPDCMAYQSEGVEVHIGDQSKAAFWDEFKSRVAPVDIVIDDGSHKPRHQATTLVALLGHVRPGGVYLCEDIHGYPENIFADTVHRMAHGLHHHEGFVRDVHDDDRHLVKRATAFQAEVCAIHLYPYVAVIEKAAEPVTEFVAPKRGTEWQPFHP